MKEILSKSLKLYGKCIVGSIMCFILVMTFNAIETGFFTDTLGYKVYGVKEGEQKQVELYTHYYEDGEDTKKQEYIDKGYTLSEFTFRSQTEKKTAIIWNSLSQIFLLFVMGVFVYNDMWKLGFKDSNAVRIGVKEENKFKGFQIGFLATVPAIILLTVIATGTTSFAKNLPIALLAFFNTHLYEAIIMISNGAVRISELAPWQFIVFYALLLIIPFIAHIAYILGYKSILVSEKLIYKNK